MPQESNLADQREFKRDSKQEDRQDTKQDIRREERTKQRAEFLEGSPQPKEGDFDRRHHVHHLDKDEILREVFKELDLAVRGDRHFPRPLSLLFSSTASTLLNLENSLIPYNLNQIRQAIRSGLIAVYANYAAPQPQAVSMPDLNPPYARGGLTGRHDKPTQLPAEPPYTTGSGFYPKDYQDQENASAPWYKNREQDEQEKQAKDEEKRRHEQERRQFGPQAGQQPAGKRDWERESYKGREEANQDLPDAGYGQATQLPYEEHRGQTHQASQLPAKSREDWDIEKRERQINKDVETIEDRERREKREAYDRERKLGQREQVEHHREQEEKEREQRERERERNYPSQHGPYSPR
jgi:hypothetical protein